MPKCTIGHDPEPVPNIFHHHTLVPLDTSQCYPDIAFSVFQVAAFKKFLHSHLNRISGIPGISPMYQAAIVVTCLQCYVSLYCVNLCCFSPHTSV
jgi:hypothetical protein